MIVGIISDTHDHLINIASAVDLFNRLQCEVVLHAGDFVAPFAVKALHPLEARIIAVFGNNDGESDGIRQSFRPQDELHKAPYPFVLDSRRILLMHDPALIEDFSASGHYDVIIYGHLHKKRLDPGPPVIINPGECCGWLGNPCTVALWNTQTGEFTFHELPQMAHVS